MSASFKSRVLQPVGAISALLLLAFPASSDPVWSWQHPYPTGMPIESIDFTSSLEGWIATGAGTWISFGEVFHTADGGATWQELLVSDYSIFSVDFIDSANGWLSAFDGINGMVFHSADGGQTWTEQIDARSGEAIVGLDFTDDDYGQSVGYDGWIARTMDGGASWSPQGSGTDELLRDIDFPDITNGWAVGNLNGAILHTSTAGAFWQTEPTGTSSYFYGVDFVDATHGWVAGEAGIFARIGSSPWTLQIPGNFSDIDFCDQNNGAATSGYSATPAVAVTSNGGTFWSLENLMSIIPFSYDNDMTCVSVPAPGVVYAANERGLVLKREGGSWDMLSDCVAQADLKSVCCTDAYHAWACGDSGVVLRTSNGGVDWALAQVPSTSVRLSDISFPSSSLGFACGYSPAYPHPGAVYRTTDGGATWTDCTPSLSPAVRMLNSIDFADGLRGVAVGAQGEIIRTTDGGLTWTRLVETPNNLNRVRFADSETGYAAGDAGTLLRFDFTGDSWCTQFSATNGNLYTLFALNPDTAWAAGWNGTVVRTWNSGNNWYKIAETGSEYYDIWFFDAMNGFLGGIYTTANGGQTMSPFPGWRDNLILRFCFTAPDCGWGVGNGSNIFRFAEEGTGVGEPQDPLPTVPCTGLLCTPNPFHGSAVVTFDVADQAVPVTLSLYDLSGRLVARLLDGTITGAGLQSVAIDGSTLPAGLYALRLEQEGFTATGTCIRLP